jgi:hypothetical protein
MEGPYQLVVCADGTNLLGENTNITKKRTETVPEANEKTDLELNADRTKCVYAMRLQDKIIMHVNPLKMRQN